MWILYKQITKCGIKTPLICPFCFQWIGKECTLYMEKETDLWLVREVFFTSPRASMKKWLINNHNIHYVGGNITAEDGMRQIDNYIIEYPDEMFDVVVCSYVLERVQMYLQALKELHRV